MYVGMHVIILPVESNKDTPRHLVPVAHDTTFNSPFTTATDKIPSQTVAQLTDYIGFNFAALFTIENSRYKRQNMISTPDLLAHD